MSSKYSILAKNYNDRRYSMVEWEYSRFKAIKTFIKALRKYDVVEFIRRR